MKVFENKSSHILEAEDIADRIFNHGPEVEKEMFNVIHKRLIKNHQNSLQHLRNFK